MSSLQEPRISQIARIFSVGHFVKFVSFVVLAAESQMVRDYSGHLVNIFENQFFIRGDL